MRITLAFLLALALSGCAALATQDINRAIGLAQSANDTAGLRCLQAQKLVFGVEPIGVFTVAEQARLLVAAQNQCIGVTTLALPTTAPAK